MLDHYATLGAAPDASHEALRRAYRARARLLHPDTSGGDAVAMAALNEAWAVLGDPRRRASYDRAREARRTTAEPIGASGDPGREGDDVDLDEVEATGPPARRALTFLVATAFVGVALVLLVTMLLGFMVGPDQTPGEP